jgi:hypothetical protein
MDGESPSKAIAVDLSPNGANYLKTGTSDDVRLKDCLVFGPLKTKWLESISTLRPQKATPVQDYPAHIPIG